MEDLTLKPNKSQKLAWSAYQNSLENGDLKNIINGQMSSFQQLSFSAS